MNDRQSMNQCSDTQLADGSLINAVDDHIWKEFYSHSYTVLFKCEKCDHEFDIDGWFYQFETLACPKCGLFYSGIFGQLKVNNENGRPSTQMLLETFEGKRLDFSIPAGIKKLTDKNGHIVLVIFLKYPDQQYKPWGMIDYSETKPQFERFNSASGSGGQKSKKAGDHPQKSFLANLLFG